ncbi:MAG: hypothetical protein HKP53_03805 [Eudoraea sp.]|nr:hypothetical protein [Eudoraea sp.]
MISCDEAAVISNKSQYKEASLSEKFKLKLHILFCGTCAVFSKKNKQLTSLMAKAKLCVMSDLDKKVLKQTIEEQL